MSPQLKFKPTLVFFLSLMFSILYLDSTFAQPQLKFIPESVNGAYTLRANSQFKLIVRYNRDMSDIEAVPDLPVNLSNNPTWERVNQGDDDFVDGETTFVLLWTPTEPNEFVGDDGYTFTVFDNNDPNLNLEKVIDKFIVLPASSPIPTLTQWGIFLFILLITGLGLVTIYNLQIATITTNGMLQQSRFHFPFDVAGFKKLLPHALGLATIGVGVIFIGWGEILMQDVVGLIIAVPMVAYLLYLITLFGKK